MIVTVEQSDIIREAFHARFHPTEPIGKVVEVYDDGTMSVELTPEALSVVADILSEPEAWGWRDLPVGRER